jgi:hypothetical protein
MPRAWHSTAISHWLWRLLCGSFQGVVDVASRVFVTSGASLTLGLWSMSLMSSGAVVQTERAVGERSLSDRGARGRVPSRVW